MRELLSVLTIEPLLARIRSLGVSILAYADDATFLVKWKHHIEQVLNCIIEFEKPLV